MHTQSSRLCFVILGALVLFSSCNSVKEDYSACNPGAKMSDFWAKYNLPLLSDTTYCTENSKTPGRESVTFVHYTSDDEYFREAFMPYQEAFAKAGWKVENTYTSNVHWYMYVSKDNEILGAQYTDCYSGQSRPLSRPALCLTVTRSDKKEVEEAIKRKEKRY